MNSKLQLLFLITISIIQGANIFPLAQSNTYQWEQQIWMDCDSKVLVIPTNCLNNDQKWAECYTVPKQGLCLQQEIKGVSNKLLTFQFYFFNPISKDVKILINGQQYDQNVYNNNKVVITTKLENSSISIMLSTSNAVLQNLVISTFCNDNCKTCDQNYDCSECMDSYSLINYQCVPDQCFDDLGNLSTKSARESNALINTSNNYQATIVFDVNLGQCLIPKVYLISRLNSNQIEYVLDKEQISLISKNQLQFYLTLEQITHKCSELITTKEKKIYQCEIGVALTLSKITQYTILLVGQININLSTQATSATTQVINVPDGNGSMQFNVANEITSVEIKDTTLIVKQTIYDKDVSNTNINLASAYMVQDGKSYQNLQLVKYQKLDQDVQYQFNILNSNIDFHKEIDLNLTSTLPQSRRMLSGERSNLQVSYTAQSTYKFYPSELAIGNLSSGSSHYIVIGSTIFFGLAGLVGCYFFLKKEKRIPFVGEDSNLKLN